jgi:hypothetical protein
MARVVAGGVRGRAGAWLFEACNEGEAMEWEICWYKDNIKNQANSKSRSTANQSITDHDRQTIDENSSARINKLTARAPPPKHTLSVKSIDAPAPVGIAVIVFVPLPPPLGISKAAISIHHAVVTVHWIAMDRTASKASFDARVVEGGALSLPWVYWGVGEAAVLSGRAEITLVLMVFGVRRTHVIEIYFLCCLLALHNDVVPWFACFSLSPTIK